MHGVEDISGGSRISEKGGPAFFFFSFQQERGGGVNFAKKKRDNNKQTIGVFLTVQEFIKTYPWKYPGEGGLGVLPQKNFKKITTKSCNSKHF